MGNEQIELRGEEWSGDRWGEDYVLSQSTKDRAQRREILRSGREENGGRQT